MENEKIILDGSDVYVSPLEIEECQGGCESGRVTHYVTLDLRGNGATADVWRGCESCAEAFAADLRASLPSAPEGGTA